MKLLYCFLLILYPYPTPAQNPIPPLSIGDKLPDISLTLSTNNKPQTANLYQYKAKLLVLDFWATWCSSCLKKFPMLDSLKKLHGNSMQVLLITNEKSEKVQKLFKKIDPGNKLQLPVVINDTSLSQLFPHRHLPHYAWLDSNFKVIAITGPAEMTAANISAAIKSRLAALPVKEDLETFRPEKPLFINGNGGNGATIRFRSTLTGYISGLPSGGTIGKDKNGLITRILATNTPVLQLLVQAYRPGIGRARFRLAFPDSNSIIYTNKDDALIQANSYTYELITLPVTKETAYRYMQHDLQRWFSIDAKTEILPTFCYILQADTAILQKHVSTKAKGPNTLYEKTGRYMTGRNTTYLAVFLEHSLGIPVVDETGFSRNISIALPAGDIGNIAALQKALHAYGFTLTPAQRMLSNFIIYQSN